MERNRSDDSTDAPAYRDFISDALFDSIKRELRSVDSVQGLTQLGRGGGVENSDSLLFVRDLYDACKAPLRAVLDQRVFDRKFIDDRVAACSQLNRSLKCPAVVGGDAATGTALSLTVIGQCDATGRVVVGPLHGGYCGAGGGDPVATIPQFLRGHHVTLFGPPDDAKLSINAMNAFHRKVEGEPQIVEELLAHSTLRVMWGADSEDSIAPLREKLVSAAQNLTDCIHQCISHRDPTAGREYRLAPSHLSLPIKRFAGLAIPCAFLFRGRNPIPLHLYDFALHLHANWDQPEALVFYVPKLETVEEAAYIHHMVEQGERMIHALHSSYKIGTVRLLIVLENARAIFRVHEMMDALHPYFAGASLGWHDYLASTARLFKNDPNYHMPPKSDPLIVVGQMGPSHDLLNQVVGSRGGLKIGGMYGVLPLSNDRSSDSFQIAIAGFFRDVIWQLQRGLEGFWVAHPDFARIGLAIVEGWRCFQQGNRAPLETLIDSYLLPAHRLAVRSLLDLHSSVAMPRASDPLRLLAASQRDGSESNNAPDKIAENIFQSLQYLADWLSGNGCVALPAMIDGVAVRVMDDLATAERSRWEVWHEVHGGRISSLDVVIAAHTQMHFIHKDLSRDGKSVQVKWSDRTRKWYPVAMHVMLHAMTSDEPVEFLSQLLLPCTVDSIRASVDPLAALCAVDGTKYALPARVARFHRYFGSCGSRAFAREMARQPLLDLDAVRRHINTMTETDIQDAALFHGDIGESARSLDANASQEQSLVQNESREMLAELQSRGAQYRQRFGFKFLISATGKSASELLGALTRRLENPKEIELEAARDALSNIACARLAEGDDGVIDQMREALSRHAVVGASICVIEMDSDGVCDTVQEILLGMGRMGEPVQSQTRFEIASLSKSVATAVALECFRRRGIGLETSVNALLQKCGSAFRICSHDPAHPQWANRVTLAHLMSHRALNMHFVRGVPADCPMPSIDAWLDGGDVTGGEAIGVINEPGSVFQYSGGGFVVLEHLLIQLEGKPIDSLIKAFSRAIGLTTSFSDDGCAAGCSTGYLSGVTGHEIEVQGTRKSFPRLAAGMLARASDVGKFLCVLTRAFHTLDGAGAITHDTAVQMLHGIDGGAGHGGAGAFMGCDHGLGIFIAEAGANRLCIHQGANDGFRALFVHVFAGPDHGKGFVVLCNGDESGVGFVAECAQILLRQMGIAGVDCSRFKDECDSASVAIEHRVNAAYRDRVFAAFEPDLPEAIAAHGAPDALAPFNRVVGARIVAVSNQRFARAENLLSADEPTFDPSLFGRQGKVMDSWESARHNPSAFDWMIFELGAPTQIECATISTQFHQGNQAESIRVEGWDDAQSAWCVVVAQTTLRGHAFHAVESCAGSQSFQRFRVSLYPDGGVTRLALYGGDLPLHERRRLFQRSGSPFGAFDAKTHKPMTPQFPSTDEVAAEVAKELLARTSCDVASRACGGRIVSVSNEQYGASIQLLSPFPPLHMFDGFESARSRTLDHCESVIIQLGQATAIDHIELDFTFFINNNPREIELHGRAGGVWHPLVGRTPVKAYAGNAIRFQIDGARVCDQVRLQVYPDGGVNRVRVFAKS